MSGVRASRAMRFAVLAARLYLGGVFLWACWHKLLHPEAFALDIATYQLLPLSLVNILAITLPWVEAIAGLSLVLGVRPRAGALLAAGMMVMFLGALGFALAQGLELSCGCFASQGAKTDPISYWTVLRDVAWLGLAVALVTPWPWRAAGNPTLRP